MALTCLNGEKPVNGVCADGSQPKERGGVTSRGADESTVTELGGVTLRLKRIEKALTQPAQPKYSTATVQSAESYRWAKRSFAEQYDLGYDELTPRVNALGQLWFDEHGWWPQGPQLFQWDVAQNSIWTYAMGFSQFHAVFGIDTPGEGVINYFNDPVRGLQPSRPLQPGERDLEKEFAGISAPRVNRIYNAEDLPNILAALSPVKRPSGSGRVGRTARTFDRAQLAEAATDRWRGLLLEEPEDAELTSLVSDYIKEANAFWIRESGSLDFDTFVTNRIEAQDRHAFLYSKKPEFQSDAEYMGGFRQVVGQFGLGSSGTLRQLEIGASSGAGLAGFGERVSRTREARVINQGAFSQRLAASFADSGLGGS